MTFWSRVYLTSLAMACFVVLIVTIFGNINSKPEFSIWSENVEIEKAELVVSEYDPKKISQALLGFKVKLRQPIKSNGQTIDEVFVDPIIGTGHFQLFIPIAYPEKQYAFRKIKIMDSQFFCKSIK